MIDPNIALGVRPVQPVPVPNYIDQYAKIQGIRNTQAETELRQKEGAVQDEKLKQDQIATAKQQRDQQDAERVRQAFLQSNGDPKSTVDLAIKNGAGPDAITGLQKHFSDLEEKTAKIAQDQLPVQIAKNSQMTDLANGAIQLATQNPQQYAQSWPQILERAKAIDTKAADHFDPNMPATPQQLQTTLALYGTHDFFLKQEAEKRAAAGEARTEALAPSVKKKAENEAITTAPNAAGLTPAQAQTAQQAANTLTETKARDEATAANQRGMLGARQAEVALQAKKFTAEYGGDAVKGWAATLKDNPDAVSEVPAALRTGVQQQFTKDTGLPFPKPLSGPTKTQETAARNGLAALAQVAEDIKDPEIQKRLGPIMGRLGNVEQDSGVTVGLSPEAAAKAQRLRTNMRMMAMQEGRSVFGGRIPQQLMESFQSSSPNVKMDPGLLNGALQGMQDAGMRALDTADQERFGGKMRSHEDRGITPLKIGGAGRQVGDPVTIKGKPMRVTKIYPDGTYDAQ